MPEPLLHFCDISFMIERIGSGGRAQRMRADLESKRGRVGAHQPIDSIRRDRPVQLAGAIVAERQEYYADDVCRSVGGGAAAQ